MLCFNGKSSIFIAVLFVSILQFSHAEHHGDDEDNVDGLISFAPSAFPLKSSFSSAIHSPVLELNAYIFESNVLHGNYVDHWVVLFCPKWFEPCEHLWPAYEAESGKWQRQMNKDLLHLHARFARVDCATDKVLCNTQSIEEYPTVVHYYKGVHVSQWTMRSRNGARLMASWIKKQLTTAQVEMHDFLSTTALDLVVARFWNSQGLTREGLLALALIALPLWIYSLDVKRPTLSLRHLPDSQSSRGEIPDLCQGTSRRPEEYLPQDWSTQHTSMEL